MISSDRTQEFTVDQISEMAYRLAGLLNDSQAMSVAKAANARRFMQATLMALEADGLFARTTTFVDVPLVAGTQAYALDATVVGVTGVAQYTVAFTHTDQRVSQISPEEWASMPAKDLAGVPTLFYHERSNGSVYLHPIPDSSLAVLRIQVQRLRASCLDGSKTPDVERWWTDYLRWKLAHDLAVAASRNITVCGYLGAQYEKAYATARNASRPNLENQFYVG